MITRNQQIKNLNEVYAQSNSSINIVYGRIGSGKTTLLRSFLTDKQSLWYCAMPASMTEHKNNFIKAVKYSKGEEVLTNITKDDSFLKILTETAALFDGKLVLVIEDFENLFKVSPEFFGDLIRAIRAKNFPVNLKVLLSSSSVYYVENSFVQTVGSAAMYINSFIKLREFSFVETVRMFPDYSVEDIINLYSITGGVPGYLASFSPRKSLKDNIVEQILNPKGAMYLAGHEFVKNELRETGVYNTILSAISSGHEKLNDIFDYTGYGRDKISVYLKNLMEREIIEKVFSYDSKGYANTKKGMYRIKDKHVHFFYRFIYPNMTALNLMGGNEFFDRFISDSLKDYASYTFTMVAHEYLELMNRSGSLPFSIEKIGSWYGKKGDVSIICESANGHFIIGQTNSTEKKLEIRDYEDLISNANLACIAAEHVFLFSLGGFSDELREYANDNNIVLIGIEDL